MKYVGSAIIGAAIGPGICDWQLTEAGLDFAAKHNARSRAARAVLVGNVMSLVMVCRSMDERRLPTNPSETSQQSLDLEAGAELLAFERERHRFGPPLGDGVEVPPLAEALALLDHARVVFSQISEGGKPHAQQKRDVVRVLPRIDALLGRYPDPDSVLADEGASLDRFFFAVEDDRELRRQLHRAQLLRSQAVEVCERRTSELGRARATIAELTEDAALGRALAGLGEQIARLRRTRCPSMGFGFEPCDLLDALAAELAELRAERPGSARARLESADVVTLAHHIALANGLPQLEGLQQAASKLRRRLDFIDAGGTWKGAKEHENAPAAIAWTIGARASYDRAQAEAVADGRRMTKPGKGDRGRDSSYAGGWVWARLADARAAAKSWGAENKMEFAVYRIELPQPWELCTEVGDDGQHHLLVEAPIIGRECPW